MTNLSRRIQRIEPSATLAISAKAARMRARGADVISFGAGEPDFDTPEPIAEAAKAAIDAGKTRYLPSAGLDELREAIAADYQRRSRQVTPEQVVVTVGGKQALYNATQVLFDDGDRVVVPAPYWVSYPAQLRLAGAEPVELETTVDSHYKIEPRDLDRVLGTPDVRGLILCSPSNPTGATYSADELRQLAEVIDAHPEVVVYFDAIYDRLYYEADFAPDLVALFEDLADRVVTFNGFSKTYAMTGWRLGYAIGPEEIISQMGKLQSQSTSNATSFAQYGALAAFDLDDQVIADRRRVFEQRRDLIVEKLRAIEGVECPRPAGAFYVFPDFSDYVGTDAPFADDLELANYLLEEAEVAVVPGSAFGAPGGIRLSYAMGEDAIERGVDRIANALNDVRG